MRCPKCNEPIFNLNLPCPHCHFLGEPAAVQELHHIRWLLNEARGWTVHTPETQALVEPYRARERRLLISLGLRFAPDAAPEAWRRLREREFLRATLQRWQNAGLFRPERLQAILAEIQAELDELRRKLEGYDPPFSVDRDRVRLDAVNYVLAFLNGLDARRDVISPNAIQRMRATIVAEQERLENALGLRPAAP